MRICFPLLLILLFPRFFGKFTVEQKCLQHLHFFAFDMEGCMSIEVWVKSIYEWIYPILPRTTPPAPKVPLEVFKEKLLLLSALSITNENCAKGCVESVMEVLQPAHFDLSEVGQNEILSYVEQFKTAAASTAYLYEEEQLPAILAFKKALGEAIKDKWVKGMAE